MTDNRVTIFIPLSHFHDEYLRQAIACVFAQTRADWRLLIVADQPAALRLPSLLPDALGDPRVRVTPLRGRLLAGAYNTAMRECETEFIAALFGDDLWVPAAVEVLGRAIRSGPEVDFFHSGRYFIDGDSRRISSDYPPRASVSPGDFSEVSPVKHLLCWRARMGLACGGVDETLNNFASDDYDFPWTMAEHGAVFKAIPEALYVIRDHREGYRLTTHVPRSVQLQELRRIMHKHGASADQIERRVRHAKRSYLKQSLFRNNVHRWILERIGFDARRGWREPYR